MNTYFDCGNREITPAENKAADLRVYRADKKTRQAAKQLATRSRNLRNLHG